MMNVYLTRSQIENGRGGRCYAFVAVGFIALSLVWAAGTAGSIVPAGRGDTGFTDPAIFHLAIADHGFIPDAVYHLGHGSRISSSGAERDHSVFDVIQRVFAGKFSAATAEPCCKRTARSEPGANSTDNVLDHARRVDLEQRNDLTEKEQ